MEWPTKADFSLYKTNSLKHWIMLFWVCILSFVGGAKDIAETWFGGFVMPGWVFYILAGMCLVVAQFLTWLDMKRERDKEREEKERLRQFNVTQDSLENLGKYRQQLIKHQNKPIIDEIVLGSWKTDYENLKKEISEYISKNISPAESELFDVLGHFRLYVFGDELNLNGEISQTHIQFKSMIIRDYEWIEELVKDYARQRGWNSDRLLCEK